MEQKDSSQRADISIEGPFDATIKEALSSDRIRHLYANGFVTALGNGDVLLILQQNGAPIAAINLSYTVAKTLAQKLGDLIKKFETNADHIIMTSDFVDNVLVKQPEKSE